MVNPTATLTWDGLEAYLTRLYDMPANVIWRQEESRRRGKPTISSADAANRGSMRSNESTRRGTRCARF